MQETATAEPPRSLLSNLLARVIAHLALSSIAWFVAAAVVLAIGAYLRFHRLGEGGLGNSFYAAAVRSMQESLHNFFFVALDHHGAYMIDKPPVGLWLQAISARVLGYDGFALMLPQAAGGVLAIALTLVVVRRLHGDSAGLVAAATLAVLPASVLVARNNTMDSAMVAVVMLAIAATVRATETGRLHWLLAGAVLGGVAFNIKGFEAMLALPGTLLFFAFASRLAMKTRALQLSLAGAAFIAVALSWTSVVGLVGADDRPLVLNSDGNWIWSLTFGYNGFDRILGGEGFNPATALTSQNPNIVPIGVLYGGETGPLRLLGDFPGPLVALMLPAALAGAILLVYDLRYPEKRGASTLWLLWLVAGAVAFSASRLGSAHYLESFAPALAACVGLAGEAAVSGGGLRRAVGLAGVVGSAVYMLDRYTLYGEIGDTVRFLAYAAIVAAVLALVAGMLARRVPSVGAAAGGAACALLLAVPLLVSRESVEAAPVEGILPGTVFLALDGSREPRLNLNQPTYYFITGEIGYLNQPLGYLERVRAEGQYAAAVTSFYTAAPIISQRDLPVLPLYSEFRTRPEMPVEHLRELMDSGRLTHFMVSLQRLTNVHPEAAELVRERCQDVSRIAGAVPQIGVQVFRCDSP